MLYVHRAERADLLADGLAQTLLAPLEDPFAPEVVAVPTRGIERWLTQRLSTRLGAGEGRADGVCANVEFPFPGRLVLGALASATGLDPADDRWPAERLVWPLLEVVDRCLREPWLAALAAHLKGGRGESGDPTRRFGAVRRIADLFDRYGVHRPEMVRGWATGEWPGRPGGGPAGGSGAGSGCGEPGAAWQAELWRALRELLGQPSPAERLPVACGRIRSEPELLDLPARVSLFGLTRIPRSYLDVLAAIAWARDVHLFVLHPSPALWKQVQGALQGGARVLHRRADPTAQLPANRLLASWGRDARELQLVLDVTGQSVDRHHPLEHAGATLLGRIQADVRENRQPPGAPLPGEPDQRPSLDPRDRSVQVHACHGRARQVEVLRDAVLHELEQDPTLEPRDVIVMCPDIEVFAPLIQATFGAGRAERTAVGDDRPAVGDERCAGGDDHGLDGERLPDLRVRLADRSLRQTNPVLGVIAQLLELADGRATASGLLDFADREPVRRRFRFDDDDVTRMQEWVAASGIRWGLDAAHRRPFKLDMVPVGTWRAGLDRILLGAAISEEGGRMVGGVLPLDDVDSGAIDLAGRLAEYVERVGTAVDELSGAKAIDGWVGAIAGAADALTATSERDSWQRRELQRVLDDVLAEAGETEVLAEPGRDAQPGGVPLELADVRALLADRLRGRPTRASFRTGHLTVCTLVPMRSVPHRVVCVLGLDDGQFPRRAWRDGDDLMLEDPHVGDRDPRAEDRQMLLDALLAASERLILFYTGSDERTNLTRPPAVPVGELLDIADRTVRAEHGASREQVLVSHPLQPFDPRNFTNGALVPERAWGFDPVALDGARALRGPRAQSGRFLSRPLPPLEPGLIELESLVRFVEHPVRAFLRGRLGVAVRRSADEVNDALAIELDGLDQWGVGQRLLDGVLAGAELEDCVRAELARGSLPPGRLAAPVLDRARPVVAQLAAAARALGGESAGSLDVNVRLADGRVLAGTVPGVCGQTVRRVSYARVKPRERLVAWVRLLALSAARCELPFESAVIGRARAGAYSARVTVARIQALGEDPVARRQAALSELAVLVDLFDRGMREPLPVASGATAAYAQAAVAGGDPESAARGLWETGFGYPKEDQEPEHVLAFGGSIGFAQLLAAAPHADEAGPGWDLSEPSRFGRCALRLWGGLLAREAITDR